MGLLKPIKLDYVTPQMYGAKGDGITDDTQAIQKAFDSSKFVYIPDGVYMVNGDNAGWGTHTEGGVYPQSGQKIIMSGNAKLKAITNENGFYNVLNIREVNDVHIIGGKVEGDKESHNGTEGNQGYGISIWASNNIVIENVEIFNCFTDSIIIGYANDVDSTNITIDNCILHDSRRQGISIIGCEKAVIRNCEIYNISGANPMCGIDIEPDGTGKANNITIDNCYIHDTEHASVVLGGNDPTNVKIVNNNMRGLNVSASGNNVLVDNCDMKSIYSIVPHYILVSNSNLEYAEVSGGNMIFNNCNFENSDKTYMFSTSLDNFPNRISERISFDHCRFKGNSNNTYLLQLTHPASGSTEYQEKIIEFSDCKIDLQGGGSFSNRMPGEELKLDNCDIIVKDNAYQVFTINNFKPTRFIMNNCRVKCSTVITYLFSTSPQEHYFNFMNNEISDFQQLLYCESGASGELRLLNNKMSNKKIIGTNTINVVSDEEWVFTLADGSTVTKKVALI